MDNAAWKAAVTLFNDHFSRAEKEAGAALRPRLISAAGGDPSAVLHCSEKTVLKGLVLLNQHNYSNDSLAVGPTPRVQGIGPATSHSSGLGIRRQSADEFHKFPVTKIETIPCIYKKHSFKFKYPNAGYST